MNILFLLPLILSLLILVVSYRVAEEVELIGIRSVAIVGVVISLSVAPLWFQGILLLWLLRSERASLPQKF